MSFTLAVNETIASPSKGKISPLQFAEKAVGEVVPSDNAYQLRQEREDIVFVSVREPESIAMAGGNIIKGAKVMPLSELTKNLDKIDCKKDSVFICEGTFDGGECSASPAACKIVIDKLGCKAAHMKYLLESHGAWEAAGYPVEPYKK
jgi:rhodanese-related sulfurtransferase